jgi:hypothetical protein
MRKSKLGIAGLGVFALLLSVAAFQAKPQAVNFAGTWEMTVTGGGQGRAGGQGGGAGYRGGAESLTIAQDGDKFKVSHKTQRGEKTYNAVVSGDTISWMEERQIHEGNTMKIEFKATLDGDTMKGTMGGGQSTREFTAKRSK